MNQRELAYELEISLGKANYCLRALNKKGWVKVRNFKKSNNKRAYAYFLTLKGIDEKARVTVRFFKYKIAECKALKEEITRLKQEVTAGNPTILARMARVEVKHSALVQKQSKN